MKIDEIKAGADRIATDSCNRGLARMAASSASTEKKAVPHKTSDENIEPVMIQCEAIIFANASSCKRKNGRWTL